MICYTHVCNLLKVLWAIVGVGCNSDLWWAFYCWFAVATSSTFRDLVIICAHFSCFLQDLVAIFVFDGILVLVLHLRSTMEIFSWRIAWMWWLFALTVAIKVLWISLGVWNCEVGICEVCMLCILLLNHWQCWNACQKYVWIR